MQPRRQIALLLVLLALLAPLANGLCGVACLNTNPAPSAHQAMPAMRHCLHAAGCCHTRGAALCTAPDRLAAQWAIRAEITQLAQNHPAASLSHFEHPLPRSSAARAAAALGSPPGDPPASNSTPLRV